MRSASILRRSHVCLKKVSISGGVMRLFAHVEFAVTFYTGIAELALVCAAAVDPRNLAAAAWHRRTPNTVDAETRAALIARTDIYRVLVEDAFEYLHVVSTCAAKDDESGRIGGADENMRDSVAHRISAATASVELNAMLQVVMNGDDELAKLHVFRFLVKHNLEGLLVGQRNKSFERFIIGFVVFISWAIKCRTI